MSDTATASTEHESHGGVAHDDHGHPTEVQYWLVFLVLAVITALEVLWSYLGFSGAALVVPLILMMVVKFVIVAGVFMHLWFDMKMINGKIFTMAFVAGIVIALAVYISVVATFEFNI